MLGKVDEGVFIVRKPVAMFYIVAGILAASPATAVPEPVAIRAEAVVDVAINDKATELAQFLYSRDDMAKQLDQILAVSLPQSMKSGSDFGIYETEYPGLIAAVVAALKPVMLKAYDDKMPLLWQTTSQIYWEKFSPAELDQLITFFKSPVGIRFANALKGNVDTQQFMDAAVASEGELTESVTAAKKKAAAAAVRKTNQQMSSADKIAIFRFENSALGPKLASVGPTISKAVMEWDYYFADEKKREFLEIRQAAIREFVAKADAQSQLMDATSSAPLPSNP